jgi:cell division protein FtsZ
MQEGVKMTSMSDQDLRVAKLKMVGVGGGGGNAVNTMIKSGFSGVDYVVANTDLQALAKSEAQDRIQLGPRLTKGLGAGGNPEVGRNAALEDEKRLSEALAGADMVFVTAGMGGGTGTGAAPEVARIARSVGALTVGVVTRPFHFEGKRRRRQADLGIEAMKEHVDTLIVIPNQRLLAVAGDTTGLGQAFYMADSVLLNAVRGVSELITVKGFINVDFADVRAVMAGAGMALMGTGRATGENRAIMAARQAIESPLLEDISIKGATGILINITGSEDMTLAEVNEAACLIEEEADEDANIIFGAVFDPELSNEIKITVIATGFESQAVADEYAYAAQHSAIRRAPQQPVAAFHQASPFPQAPPASRFNNLHAATPVQGSPAHQTPIPRQQTPAYPQPARELKTPVPRQQKPPAAKDREFFDLGGIDEGDMDIPTFLRRT